MNLGLWFGLATGCGGAAAPVGAAPEAAERIVLPGPVFGGPPLLGRATVDVDGPISPLAARLATRWVGRLPEGMSTCPQPSSGFTVEPLFGPGAPGQLARYCLYLASIQDPPPLQVIQPPQGFEIDADLQVLTSQARAGALTDVMVGPYQDLFEQQVERFPPSGPAAGPLPRLVLVDTSPTPPPGRAPWEVPGRDVHGYTLANMAHNQGCDAAGECAAKIESRLGLQLIKDASGRVVPDELHGGEFGTISYLASAVFGALSSGGPGGGPVIINLSLGWDPEWGGDLAQRATWHPGIRAMYDVLYHAACRGALVFAAAGNRLGGPPPDDQPLYPAGWEKVEIEAGACLDVSGVPAAAGVTLDQPIVWAVGGVDEYGNDLALSRKDSRPGLVAFGSHGVTTDGAGAPTAILTGTSVSTLVASIAAAAVWSNLPSLRPIDVVQTLRDSGVPAGPVAPYWCPAGCGDAAWIDVCEAVRHACETGPTAG
ncbi:MAG TPA: S8/S53 family peptidase, partial [Myxococcota bacterium]|nr:S8/S53 family peptidase [Myxococcota bacterium]